MVVVSLPENNYQSEREYYILNLKQVSWSEESKAEKNQKKEQAMFVSED